MSTEIGSAPVVAGVDRRPHDDRVLALALRQASQHASALRVVHVIDLGTTVPTPARDAGHARRMAAERAEHREILRAEVLDRVAVIRAGRPDEPDVEVLIELGDPATVLLATATHCRMIVLGTRSMSARTPFLLGSVSQDVAVHAACPVLLVPRPN